ncbi:uncharacterized protein LOC116246219 [Nymphaea colorata]|uniref:Uncharacterized protein n=1 Tax=Nymphaea colorata TaxID=210225 RepID=A0A5K0WFK1_9MAGN|nr:uncharacterized protein LOC116246219 [Nymphaea colorata]
MRTRNSTLNPNPNPNSSAMDPLQIEDPDEKEPAATTSPSRADAVDLSDDIVTPAVHLPEAGGKRPGTNRKKKTARKLAAEQKKMEALRQCLRPVPFSPGKPFSHFAKHERLFRRLGLWGFATLEFDRDLRLDFLASLVACYDPNSRSSTVADVRIKVSRADLARALRLPLKKDRNPTEAIEPEASADAGVPDDLSAVKDFIMNCIFVNAEDALVIPDEITGAIRFLDAGEPEKIDWAGLIWSMAEKELSRGPALSHCYYASHFQILIRSQRPELFEREEEPVSHAPAPDPVPATVPTVTEATTVEEVEDEVAKVDDADENEGGEGEAKTGSQESELNEVLNEENEMVAEAGDEQREQGSVRPCSSNEAGGTSMAPEKLEEDFRNFEQLSLPENMLSMEGNVGLAVMPVPQNIDMEPSEPDVISMGLDKNFLHLNSSVSEFGNGCKRELEDAHILQNESQKKMRHDPQWDNDFNVCMEQIGMWINRAREIHMEKHESFVNAHLNMQEFTAELRNRDQIISSLQAAQYKMSTELTRLRFELYATANLAQGYKQLLESTRKAFDEYRKRCPQMDEPLFKDVPAGGGLVLTSDELTKRLLEREEEDRASFMQWVVEKIDSFGDEWNAKFSILQRDVYRMDDRLAILESEFQLLKSRSAKADVGSADPTSN